MTISAAVNSGLSLTASSSLTKDATLVESTAAILAIGASVAPAVTPSKAVDLTDIIF